MDAGQDDIARHADHRQHDDRQHGQLPGVRPDALADVADPLLAVALVGMGITSLSMAGAAVRAVGAQLSAVSTETCAAAAAAALAAADPMAGRDAVRAVVGGA